VAAGRGLADEREVCPGPDGLGQEVLEDLALYLEDDPDGAPVLAGGKAPGEPVARAEGQPDGQMGLAVRGADEYARVPVSDGRIPRGAAASRRWGRVAP
jgi:hypothetical protein